MPRNFSVCLLFLMIFSEISTGQNFTSIITQYSDSVVNIQTQETGFRQEDLYRYYFGRDFSPSGSVVSLGSGVLLDRNHVMTTYSQVKGFVNFTLSNKDGKGRVGAKLQGVDPVLGVALLQLGADLKGASPIDGGRSETLMVGDPLIIIGNPFGKGIVAEFGLVTALEKFAGDGPFEGLIHTNIEFHPGVVGGAILDARGRLVGLSSRREIQGSQHLMVPVQQLNKVVSALKATGKVTRPWLGVEVRPKGELNPSKANEDGGVLVSNLIFDGPAQKGGIVVGDLIMSLDKVRVQGLGHFSYLLSTKEIGKKIEVKIFRPQRGEMTLFLVPLEPPKVQDLPLSDFLF